MLFRGLFQRGDRVWGQLGEAGEDEPGFLERVGVGRVLRVRDRDHAQACGGGGPQPVLTELSERILDALVDEHELSADGEGPRFRLLKRRGG